MRITRDTVADQLAAYAVRGCGRIAVKEVNGSGNQSTGAMELA